MNPSIYRFLVVILKPAFLAISLFLNHTVLADVAVIVHPSNDSSFDEQSVRLIFLGKQDEFPNNQKAIPIELAKGDIRKSFIKKYIKKSEIELQHYWSVQTFTGKGQPPQRHDNEEDIKKLIAKNPSMIGFIDSKNIDSTVKVIDIKKSKNRFDSEK